MDEKEHYQNLFLPEATTLACPLRHKLKSLIEMFSQNISEHQSLDVELVHLTEG